MIKKHYHPETPLKRDLTKTLRTALIGYLVLRIENNASNGISDIIVVGNKITSFIEVKYADPDFKSKGDQELMMNRLARQGYAFYVIYEEKERKQRTYIVQPKDINVPLDQCTTWMEGFNHLWIAHYVYGIHNGNHAV
jgi:hypothetical protein